MLKICVLQLCWKVMKKLWSSISSTVTGCRRASLLKSNSYTALCKEISPNFLEKKFSVNAPFPQISLCFTEKFSSWKMVKFLCTMRCCTLIYYTKNLQKKVSGKCGEHWQTPFFVGYTQWLPHKISSSNQINSPNNRDWHKSQSIYSLFHYRGNY